MSAIAEPTMVTPEDLLAMPDGNLYELVDGELVEQNTSFIAAMIGANVNSQVKQFTAKHDLGLLAQSDASYQCFPDLPNQVRRPDGSFIRKGRLTREQFEAGHIRIAPDWLLEVLSPNDLVTDIETKIDEYLRAGVRLIWVVHPDARTVYVYRADGRTTRLRETDELDGEDVIPGFRCPVREIFPTADQLKSLLK